MELDRAIDLKRGLRMLWRRRALMAVVLVALTCSTLVTLALVPRSYRSSATLLIEDREPLTPELERAMGGRNALLPQPIGRDEARLSQIAERVRTRAFLERVIKILRLDEDPRMRREAAKRADDYPHLTQDEITVRLLVEALQSRVRVRLTGAGIYNIAVMDHEPETAHLLAKWISELFVDISVQRELEQIQTARSFGSEQVAVYEAKLRDAEEALEAYQSRLIHQHLAAPSFPPERLRAAEAAERVLQEDAGTARSRQAALDRTAGQSGFTFQDLSRLQADREVAQANRRLVDTAADAIFAALSTAQDAASLDVRPLLLGHRSKMFQSVEARAAQIFPAAAEDDRIQLANAVFARLDAEACGAIAQKLRQSIQSLRWKSQAGPAQDLEVARLQQEVDKNRTVLGSFRDQLVASDISQAAETTNLGLRVEIIDPAQLPLKASWPDTTKVLLLAGLLGLFLSASLAFLAEFMDPTLRSLEDIARVAPEPILGTLPLVGKTVLAPQGVVRRRWVTAGATGLVLLTLGFFLAKATFLPDFVLVKTPIHAVNPDGEQR